jgi:small subunit ribosomal protein S4
MKRKHKLYVRPKKAYEKTRIKEENSLMGKYGLKNKVEIWKSIAKIDYFRRRAKALALASSEEQQVFFSKLKKIGLNAESISDVLDLKVENILSRRLPTIVYQKKLAPTAQQARQLVVHKKVLIDGKVINIPSYIVSVSEEKLITIRPSKPKAAPKQDAVAAEVKVEEKK